MRAHWCLVGLVPLLAAACGPDVATKPGCIPGEEDVCECADGRAGRQICQADRTSYGPCECDSLDVGDVALDREIDDPDEAAEEPMGDLGHVIKIDKTHYRDKFTTATVGR